MRVHLLVFSFYLVGLIISPQVLAATADGGSGPYADEVTGFTQGNKKDGSSVDAGDSDGNNAIGAVDGVAVSLGFGGSIDLRFENNNAIADKIDITEVSGGGDLAMESVDVLMSRNGTDWEYAGSENRSGSVSLPDELECALFVRLIDNSDESQHVSSANGYDVDAVESVNPGSCEATPTSPTPTPTDTPAPTSAPTGDNSSDSSEDVSTDDDSSDSNSSSSSDSSDSSSKSMNLSKNGPTCAQTDFSVEVELTNDNVAAGDKLVVFRYGAIQKTATTNSSGKAGVIFSYFGSGEIVAESTGYPSQKLTMGSLTCNGQVLGSSDTDAVGGRVLGATTERLATTGSSGYIQLFLLTGAATSALVLIVMKYLEI